MSRPEALASGSTDWLVEPAAGTAVSPVVKVAARRAAANRVAKAKVADPTVADRTDRTSSIKKPPAVQPKSQAAL